MLKCYEEAMDPDLSIIWTKKVISGQIKWHLLLRLGSCHQFSKMSECIDYGTKVCLFVLKCATNIWQKSKYFRFSDRSQISQVCHVTLLNFFSSKFLFSVDYFNLYIICLITRTLMSKIWSHALKNITRRLLILLTFYFTNFSVRAHSSRES